METTFEKIKSYSPCKDGWEKLLAYYRPENLSESISIEEIIKSNGIKDAVWALRCIEEKDQLNNVYLFCADVAESVLSIFEKKYPEDKRPQLAIKAVRDFVNGRINLETLKTAAADADAAYDAAYAAYAAAAADAAYAAAAADAAAAAADAAAYAAAYAAYAAADADAADADAADAAAAAADAAAADAAAADADARLNKWQEIEDLLKNTYNMGNKEKIKELEKRVGELEKLSGVKKPLFKIGDTEMFEGGYICYISKVSNFKLFESKVDIFAVEDIDSADFVFFPSKEEALKYMLNVAKNKFKGCGHAKYETGCIERPINASIFKIMESSDFGMGIFGSGYYVWLEKLGWIAEPVKEEPLMLGEYEVWISKNKSVIHWGRNSNEYILSKEWMEWDEKFNKALGLCVDFSMYLGRYKVKFFNGVKIDIGRLEDVTLNQIQAITNKLNEL